MAIEQKNEVSLHLESTGHVIVQTVAVYFDGENEVSRAAPSRVPIAPEDSLDSTDLNVASICRTWREFTSPKV